MEEFGGKQLSKSMIVYLIEVSDRVDEDLIAKLTGLPVEIVVQLLKELEQEGCVYHEMLGRLKLWRVSMRK